METNGIPLSGDALERLRQQMAVPATEPPTEQEIAQISLVGAEEGTVEPRQPLNIPSAAPMLDRTGEALWGQKPKSKNELSDLFEVPHPEDADMDTSDLFTVPDEDDHDMNIDDLVDGDLSDLTGVSQEDVMGRPPRPRKPKFRRTSKPYPTQSTMGGIRG